MRRNEREIKDFDEIVHVLNRCDTIRLGIHGEEFPYVVPISFGYEVLEDKIVLYVHGAGVGRKHDLLAKDNRVCAEADLCHGYAQNQGGITTLYESIIGCGRAEKVTGAEARKGLDLLLEHCSYPGYPVTEAEKQATTVYKIVLETVSGKRNLGTQGARAE